MKSDAEEDDFDVYFDQDKELVDISVVDRKVTLINVIKILLRILKF